MEKIVILAGPTGSGKSSVALALCEGYPLEIVNFDSLQVYRYMDIGTAKPAKKVRDRIPHHLYDIRDPDEPFNVADFLEEADEKITEICGRGKIPLFVGGSGLYARSLLLGLDELPSSEEVREELAERAGKEGLEGLYEELVGIDPLYAGKISPRDRHRVLRALEVSRLTGAPYSSRMALWEERKPRYEALFLVLTLPREDLYRRIEERADQMIDMGLVDEVKDLLRRGYTTDHSPMRALGYRSISEVLVSGGDMGEAVEIMKRETKRYAKRQTTWFRKEEALPVNAEKLEKIDELIGIFLI